MRRRSSIPSLDGFLLCLIAVVLAASLLPARGAVAHGFDLLADFAIAALFFLHGAKLERSAILQGISNWRLHALVFASTYLLFPILGLAVTLLMRGSINPQLASGILFLTLLPSTVQSSIAFTAMARGNVSAAVCSASLSNLIGIVLTPLLVSLAVSRAASGHGFDWHAARGIMLQLLVPFVAGHLLRPLIGGWVHRHKKMLMVVDRGSILLVVYSAFSAAVANGIWQVLDLADLAELLLLSGMILAAVMFVNAGVARLLDLPREDAIVLLFCGSKKSLVSGVPMAGALFAPAQVGMIVLPLMIFHQLQLFVCSWLASRYAKLAAEEEVPPQAMSGALEVEVPQGAHEISMAASERGLVISPECEPGVAANLALLAGHVRAMRGQGA